MKSTKIASVMLLTLGLTAIATAQDAPTVSTGVNGRVVRRIEARLHLSDAQRAQAKVILVQERSALAALAEQLRAERAELTAQPVFDAERTRVIAAKYAETNLAVLVERQKLRSELVALLTAQQQQRLQQMRARFGSALDARLATLGDSL
jgi:Spy/CpxP family protein refolding chaperone